MGFRTRAVKTTGFWAARCVRLFAGADAESTARLAALENGEAPALVSFCQYVGFWGRTQTRSALILWLLLRIYQTTPYFRIRNYCDRTSQLFLYNKEDFLKLVER